MKNFEELTEEQQNEVILNIGNKLTGQEIWYWEGIIHKLREYEQFVDSDEEIQKGLVDRIKRQDKKIEDLKEQLEYQDLWRKEYLSRIDKATEYIKTHTYDDSIDGDGTRLMFEKANGYNLLNILQGSDK